MDSNLADYSRFAVADDLLSRHCYRATYFGDQRDPCLVGGGVEMKMSMVFDLVHLLADRLACETPKGLRVV